MNTSMISAPILALALGLAGCGKQPEPSADTAAKESTDSSFEQGRGVGTVTAIDAANGSITLDHGAIADLNWPAMTMGFAAKPDQLSGLQVGDKVYFEIEWNGKSGSIANIRKNQ